MIRQAETADAAAAAKLAVQMWTSHDVLEMTQEFEELIVQEECAVFLAIEEGAAVGFSQCQLRHDYVEGTQSSPVGYLEGLYVQPAYRRSGIARQLLAACEGWAREMGCSEFASDCELNNQGSLVMHLALGFKEANRVICFTKHL